MDRDEKNRIRKNLGEHLNVSRTRLTDDEATFLSEFVKDYEKYKGTSHSRTNKFTGWSSDGKYTRVEQFTDTFTDHVGIRQEYSYRDDDGQSGGTTTEIRDARGILNWFRDHR